MRDRIKELRRVKASEIEPHPLNWRVHGEGQRTALTAMLEEVGIAGAVIAYETGGRLLLIDGHLRKDIMPDQEIPVLILDVDDEEAAKLLATIDPLGAMATASKERLAALLDGVEAKKEEVAKLLASIASKNNLATHKFSERLEQQLQHKFLIVIDCDDESRQLELLERFSEEGLACRALIA